MKPYEQILCEVYQCELDDLQLNVTLNPDVELLTKAAILYASQAVDECAEVAHSCVEPYTDDCDYYFNPDPITAVKTKLK